MQAGKVRLFNTVDFAVVDYESASTIIVEKAESNQSFGVFAMPVHGLVLACSSHPLSDAVKGVDLIVPDGHPVRWAMNFFHGTQLKDRVYGPTLTLHVLQKASKKNLNVFLYGGSSDMVLNQFGDFIERQYPGVKICGKYREIGPGDNTLTSEHVNSTNAHILLVGRGCPAQELWIAERMHKIDAVMMAVGAAFSFHAGTLAQAPPWMQNNGLEWLFRLIKEPKRLFRRYLTTNTMFVFLFGKELIRTVLMKTNLSTIK